MRVERGENTIVSSSIRIRLIKLSGQDDFSNLKYCPKFYSIYVRV